MSSLDKNNKNRIIEKRIILKKKNKSLSQDTSFDNKGILYKNNSKFLYSKYSNLTSHQNGEINKNNLKGSNENNNKIIVVPSLSISKKENINNTVKFRKNVLTNDMKNNDFFRRNKEINDSYKLSNLDNLQTPIKNNLYQYNIKANTKNQTSEMKINNTNSYISKNSTIDSSNINRNINLNNYNELNPISALYEREKENDIYSCYINKSKPSGNLKKVFSVTNFNEYPYLIESNRLYNKNNYHNKSTSYFKNNTIEYDDAYKRINNEGVISQFNNTNNYLDLYSNESSITKSTYQEKNGNEINNGKTHININKKYSFISKNLNLGKNKNKNKTSIGNSKHIFVHRRRLSSFLINNQNNNKNINKNQKNEDENNRIKSKYVYKNANKSFSCINLKEKINNERYSISKSKRKSKIIDINNNNEFLSMEKDHHKGGKIDLFNKTISNFKLFEDTSYKNNVPDLPSFTIVNPNFLKSIIKIQKWIKFHFKIKKIILIQKAIRKYFNDKRNKIISNNNVVVKKPLINKCQIITKKYKNRKYLEKIIFIQNYFIKYLLNKKFKIKKSINGNCYISKIIKNGKDSKYVILLQRKIRKFFKIKASKNKNENTVNYYNNNDEEISFSFNKKNLICQNNISNNYEKNRDLCNIESYSNSSPFKIANEYESNNKKMILVNKNASINSLYINNQINKQKDITKYREQNNIYNKEDNTSKTNSYKSSFKEDILSNENYHQIPKNGIPKIHKFNKNSNIQNDRYNEDLSNNDNDNQYNQCNFKDLSFISPFLSIDDKDNNYSNDKIASNIFNLNFSLKEIFLKYIHKKLIQGLKQIRRQYNIMMFIRVLFQRIIKSINQFTFFKIIRKNSNNNNRNYGKNTIFFTILERLISFNKSSFPKDIISLINSNIPICINKKKNNSTFIPYIKKENEQNLINIQLFPGNDKSLVNFIQSFLINEKNISPKREIINKYLVENKLYNRNIFTIIRYIDSLYDYLLCYSKYVNKNIFKLNVNQKKYQKPIFEKYEIIPDSSNSNFEEETIDINDKKIDATGLDSNIDNKFKYIQNYILKEGRIFSKEDNLYENNFWKDNDVLISDNNIINKKNELISIMKNKRIQQNNINKKNRIVDYLKYISDSKKQ